MWRHTVQINQGVDILRKILSFVDGKLATIAGKTSTNERHLKGMKILKDMKTGEYGYVLESQVVFGAANALLGVPGNMVVFPNVTGTDSLKITMMVPEGLHIRVESVRLDIDQEIQATY